MLEHINSNHVNFCFFYVVGDEAVRAGIARVERLLAQANDPNHHPPPPHPPPPPASDNASEEKELHDLSATSSDQVRRIACMYMY